MLSYNDFSKQVIYYQSLTGKDPLRVYAYLRNKQNKSVLHLIAAADFDKYSFVEYTFAGSFYPVIQPLKSSHV